MTQKKKTNITGISYNELSIQAGLSGLSFCIYNKPGNSVIALEHFPFNGEQHPEAITRQLRDHIQNNKLLQGPFKKVFLIHENELSSFVPQSLFNDKNLPDYLKFNIKILENDFIAYDVLKNHDLVNVYIPYININNFVFEHFGAFEYNHSSSILVNTILSKTAGKKETRMFVHVQKDHFEIVVVNNRKLLLYNTFNYTTKEDFIYYILFTAEQLALDPEVFPLYLLGTIEKDDDFYDMVYTYVRNVFFGEHYCQFAFNESVEQPQPHANMILLNSF